MVQSSYPNKTAMAAALDIYLDAMRQFVVRCMRRIPRKQLQDAIAEVLNDRRREEFAQSLARGETVAGSIEFSDFPHLVNRRWREAFAEAFNNERGVLNQLWLVLEARNRAAHRGENDLDVGYVQARLFDVEDILETTRAPEAAAQVRRIREQLLLPDVSAPTPPSPVTTTPTVPEPESQPPNGLKPWREVAPPNSDVTDGTFREAEFAADLQQVYDGRADATVYGQPLNFFKRTHVTPGMRTLMENVLQRIAGTGGDPVIQTKTGFGGGKTHSLIALYHLARNTGTAIANEDVRRVVVAAGLDPDAVNVANVAVLDGTYLSPTTAATTATGDPLDTLWGEMAHQLGGQDAYDIIGAAAREGSAPGGRELDDLLELAAPCVILVDELVLYGRNAGVDWDSVYTFVQNLTQAVRRADRAALVVALPERASEAGGERGAEVLAALDGIFGRIEATWEPLEISEAFEVVRRRLFGDEIDEAERTRTCEAFSRMYGRSRADWPDEAGEQRYLVRMTQCYPLHPEIFDRLYEDWSSSPRFQRTRGVLRMMANCISRLYRDNDLSPLIMPGDLPFRDNSLSNEFANLLDGHWEPVFSEADGDNSRADRIDAGNRRYSDVGGAARRIARTVLLGSAPGGAVRGIDVRSVRLGVVRPGHGVSAYNEALARMSGELHYLYDESGRYWFHAEENLNKVAVDRQGEFTDREVSDYIVEQLRSVAGLRRDVVVCPADSSEVSDDGLVRLVVLSPDQPLPSRSSETDQARTAAQDLLRSRGDSTRTHKNALVFLAAKNDEVRALRTSVRTYLAWDSIVNGARRIQDLAGERATQARASIERARSQIEGGLVRAWRWALSPSQTDPLKAEYSLTEFATDAATTGEIINSALDKLVREEALVTAVSPVALASVLAKFVWGTGGNRRDHIRLSELHDMLTANVYMPRLSSADVLAECVRQGTADGTFGYADSYDGASYASLRLGEPLAGLFTESMMHGLLVEREMAELAKSETPEPPRPTPARTKTTEVPEDDEDAEAWFAPTRITAKKTLRGEISLDEVRQLSDEIIRGLSDDGGAIEVEITIRAKNPNGFTRDAVSLAEQNSADLGVSVNLDTDS